MSAMSDLHYEYGSVVYQAEITKTLPRTTVFETAAIILSRPGTDYAAMRETLNQIADEIISCPSAWTDYAN
jgi:hypothetical protein